MWEQREEGRNMARQVTRRRTPVQRKQPTAATRRRTDDTNGKHAVHVDPAGMTFAQAGEYLGCSESKVRRLVADGKLQAFYIGRAARVSKAAADRFMDGGGTK
jgi:excisionase family DNA binding protein